MFLILLGHFCQIWLLFTSSSDHFDTIKKCYPEQNKKLQCFWFFRLDNLMHFVKVSLNYSGLTTTTTARPPPGRRKRLALPGGGGGPGKTPVIPAVAADFNTSATFLKRYMELDEVDRYAIGHRWACHQSTFLPFH